MGLFRGGKGGGRGGVRQCVPVVGCRQVRHTKRPSYVTEKLRTIKGRVSNPPRLWLEMHFTSGFLSLLDPPGSDLDTVGLYPLIPLVGAPSGLPTDEGGTD